MDSITVTPKSAATVASPKVIKTAKSFPSLTNVPYAAYGCEHVQELFKEKRKISQQQYSLLLQTIFEKPHAVSQMRRSPNGDAGRPSLLPTYLCLQCPYVYSEEQRDKHWQLKGHAFSVESRSGYLYCQECADFIYDPAMEEIRLQKGRRKRKLDEYLNGEDARQVTTNSQSVPCRANGLRGLYNMGQTCFMSVIMQSLVHNPLVRAFYLGEGHKNVDCEKESCTSCAMDEIFTEFYSVEKTEGYGAVNMLMGSWNSAQALAGYQQQDAHEYMQFLFHALHTENGGTSDSKSSCSCIIHKTFYGKLQSTVTCEKCKNTTIAYDPVMDLSLDVRNTAKKRKMDKTDGDAAQSRDIELRDCLERFTAKEKLSTGEYTCQNCGGEQQNATKQLSIQKLPPALSIHFKVSRARASKSSSTSPNEHPPSHIYELSSVIVHKGKMDSGHYVSYSREGNDWFMFDDSKVVLSSESDVLGAQAYLLFYLARDLD
ncbi:cysteine proteinase [Rhizodiscina lignyota]|uniref:Ubiquitin carboxyl-terminal hydrolase n=1 Tax=Rhizodiscina lignyota TaxID=1504668 RepID=A0A9P4IKU8_9PEZI|nr:cysteine proteinase [Rhizodiscina lignyota]